MLYKNDQIIFICWRRLKRIPFIIDVVINKMIHMFMQIELFVPRTTKTSNIKNWLENL